MRMKIAYKDWSYFPTTLRAMLGILAERVVGPMTHPHWDTAASTILSLPVALL